jgi:Zn-dependent peptidase ImmA (M78 family)
VKTDATYFRALLSTNKKERTAQSIKLEYLAQIYLVLSEYIDFPKINIPKIEFLSTNNPNELEAEQEIGKLEEISIQLRCCWNLGEGPIADLRYILESNGVVVTCLNTNSEKIDAFSQRTIINDGEMFIIAISSIGQTSARARFDMAHELGHILLHPWSEDIELISREEFKARERQANTFASAFLLPRSSFIKDVSFYPTTLDYYKHLKQKWNVSISAMIYRAYYLKVISFNQYQYLMRQVSKNGWREKEPGDISYSLESNVLTSAVNLLIENKVLTGPEFVSKLNKRGLAMYPHQIEELLCLEKGTLNNGEAKLGQIIELKNMSIE